MKKITALIIFCLSLLAMRVLLTGHFSFLFLLWNLFLAWLPYYLVTKAAGTVNPPARVLLFLLGILFLPNAPYIVTDLFHLKKSLVAPIWLDVMLILSFALTGLYFFMITVWHMLSTLGPYLKTAAEHSVVKILLMFLSGYGVYLGRYLRFNSWDLVTEPVHLFWSISQSFLDYQQARESLPMALTFSVFLFIIYEAYENIRQPQPEGKSFEKKN